MSSKGSSGGSSRASHGASANSINTAASANSSELTRERVMEMLGETGNLLSPLTTEGFWQSAMGSIEISKFIWIGGQTNAGSSSSSQTSWLELYPTNAFTNFPTNIGNVGLLNKQKLQRTSSKLILGLGRVAGAINQASFSQTGLFNGLAGAGLMAGNVNLGRVEQRGLLNALAGGGLLVGQVNRGEIKSQGFNAYLGVGLGVGNVNAGSMELSGEGSLVTGAGLLNGFTNLGNLETSENRDIVAGISSNFGLINGIAPFDANSASLPVLTQAEIDTKDGDDLVYGGGLYNVLEFLATQYETSIRPSVTTHGILIGGMIPTSIRAAAGVELDAMLAQAQKWIDNLGWGLTSSTLSIPLELEDATWGITNFGEIDTGNGNDKIFGAGDDVFGDLGEYLTNQFPNHAGSGILNSAEGEIELGSGDDILHGETWAGKTGSQPTGLGGLPAAGIANYGVITTGDGDDSICGLDADATVANTGIINNGKIHTGYGNDMVDALLGGFSGTGLTDLGLGDDKLIGFGSGHFNAGGGFSGEQKDTILLANGKYFVKVAPDAQGYYTLTDSKSQNGATMKIQGFELIGSANAPTTSLTNFFIATATSGLNIIEVSDSGVTITGLV